MNKIYKRINWKNAPKQETPLNEHNMNRLDMAVNELDDRVVSMDGSITSLQNYEANANFAMNEAADYAKLAQRYAVGSDDLTPPSSNDDNAKWYCQQTKKYYDEFSQIAKTVAGSIKIGNSTQPLYLLGNYIYIGERSVMYMPDHTAQITFLGGAQMTNANRWVQVCLPLNKMINPEVRDIQITISVLQIRQNDNYLQGSANNSNASGIAVSLQNDDNISFSKMTCIPVSIYKTNGQGFGGTNNSPVAIKALFDVKFV